MTSRSVSSTRRIRPIRGNKKEEEFARLESLLEKLSLDLQTRKKFAFKEVTLNWGVEVLEGAGRKAPPAIHYRAQKRAYVYLYCYTCKSQPTEYQFTN